MSAGRGGRRYYSGVRASVTPSGSGGRRACRWLAALVAAVWPATAGAQSTGAAASLLAGGTMDVRWATAPEIALSTPPAFDQETAYLTTRDGAVLAIALDTGAVQWRAEAAATFTPAVGGGLVFVTTAGGVRALAASTGRVVWEKALPGRIAAPPYWDTGWLVLSFEGGDLAAFRAADGALIWRVPLGAVAHVPPVPGLDNLYLGLADGRVVALALADGRLVWTQTFDGPASGLTALDEQVLVGTVRGAVASLHLTTGEARWRFRTGAAVVAAPVADDARIYVVAYDHLLRALDRRRGHLKWRRALPHRPAGGPVVTGGTVLVPVFATEQQGFDGRTGSPTLKMTSAGEVAGATRFRVGGRASGTRLTAVSTEGQLIAFAPRVEPAPAPIEALPGLAVPEPPAPAQPPAVPPPSPRSR